MIRPCLSEACSVHWRDIAGRRRSRLRPHSSMRWLFRGNRVGAARTPLASTALVVAIAVSPAVLYFAVTRLSVRRAAFLVAGWVALRAIPSLLLAASREQAVAALRLPLAAIFFSLLGAIANDARLLLLLPSATQFGFASVFASSMRRPGVPLVETFARMQKSGLSDDEVRYCRAVTGVWAVYLTASGVAGLLLALLASPTIWAVFTGVGSYVLVAVLFAAEYVFRQIHFRPGGRRRF